MEGQFPFHYTKLYLDGWSSNSINVTFFAIFDDGVVYRYTGFSFSTQVLSICVQVHKYIFIYKCFLEKRDVEKGRFMLNKDIFLNRKMLMIRVSFSPCVLLIKQNSGKQ